MRFHDPRLQPGKPFLEAIVDLLGTRTSIADATLEAHDSQGTLGLAPVSEPGPKFEKKEGWTPERASVGDVTVNYREPVFTQSVVPSFTLVSEARAMFGAGMTFLAVPADSRTYRLQVSWDLREMPAGSIGVWAFGRGTTQHLGKAQDLLATFYEAGVLHRYEQGQFGVYWAGEPNFDVRAYASKALKTYRYYEKFFGWSPGSYRIFLHAEPLGGSGTALKQSFLETYDPQKPESVTSLYHTLAHEMAHTFLPSIYPKDEPELAAWFHEGSAEYYSSVLPFRAGLITPQEFLATIDTSIRDYYWAPSRNLSIRQAAAAGFFKANDVQKIAYGRGRMFLAEIDAEIRAHSGGKASLDNITQAIGERERHGQPHDLNVWLKMVAARVGPEARAQFNAMMAGKLVVPPSDAFGPCFRRERADIPRFVLGFDAAELQRKNPHISGLIAGSAAAKAGVRDGDEVVSHTPLKALYRNLTARMTLRVGHAGHIRDITYLPRGRPIPSYRWVRIPGVPSSECNHL